MPFVQFTDAMETTIAVEFCGPQDPKVWPNQGEIEDTDPRYLAFVNPASTPAGQWAAHQALALAALAKSDAVMARTAEAVALGLVSWTSADVAAYAQWRRDLRAILKQTMPASIPNALPAMPPYPSGT